MKRLADIFYEKASFYPNKVAIWCDNQSLTYKELSNMVSQYSNFLLDNGVVYKDHIGIPMNNSITSVVLILAAANIGVGLVPFNPTLSLNTIKIALDVANVKHLIARRSFYEQFGEINTINLKGKSFCIDDKYEGAVQLNDVKHYSTERPIIKEITGDEIFIITMTSGSTGSPKPITLTQNNKVERAMAHVKQYGLKKEDKILAATPLYHSLAERLVLIPLLIGATSILLPRFTPKIWLNCIKEQLVTFTIAVSAQLNQIALLLPNDLEINSLRCLVSSSALLEAQVKNKLIRNLHCDFHEMYGTSEVSTVTSINFREAIEKQESVGKPLPEADVIILKDNGIHAPIGEIGEIACKSTLMCKGYYGMEDTFRESLQDNYFKTGDMGYLDEDGFLYFSGRKKELIITGGINVYPLDVEKSVMEIPEVSECAAFAYTDERLGEVVALAIVVKGGKELNKRNLRLHCARNLADFQQPHIIIFLDELPKNTMGKIVKSKLTECVRSY